MQKTDLGYYDLTESEKRVYESAYVNLMTNEALHPLTKDEVHDICMTIVDNFKYMIKDSKPYNPAD